MTDNNFSASDFVEVEAYERNGKTVQGYVRRIGGGPALLKKLKNSMLRSMELLKQFLKIRKVEILKSF